jgi:hypothetical protein
LFTDRQNVNAMVDLPLATAENTGMPSKPPPSVPLPTVPPKDPKAAARVVGTTSTYDSRPQGNAGTTFAKRATNYAQVNGSDPRKLGPTNGPANGPATTQATTTPTTTTTPTPTTPTPAQTNLSSPPSSFSSSNSSISLQPRVTGDAEKDKRERLRVEAIKEIITTEGDYIRDLDLIRSVRDS